MATQTTVRRKTPPLDCSVLEWLTDHARQEFEQGDKYILIRVVFWCALTQAVIPDWAVDALLDIQRKLNDGHLGDLNDAFGKPPTSKSQRARKARLTKHGGEVLAMLYRMRDEDGFSLNGAEIFTEAAARLHRAGAAINSRDVRDIYKTLAKGGDLKKMKRGAHAGFSIGYGQIPLSELRRTGRPIFEDALTKK